MSRTRDIIQDIADIRQRRRFADTMTEISMRLFTLEQAFEKHDSGDTKLTWFFPVALIACIESYFRGAIKDLVDAGDPYLTNAAKLLSSTKLDFSMLRAVDGKTVSVGELVAYSVQLSQLEHVESAVSILLGKSFLRQLRTTTDRWAHEVRGEPAEPILSNPDAVFADVVRAFELRHIICHEIASAYEIQSEEISRCFESCVLFLRAADEFISETLHPGAPLTQTDMTIAAENMLNQAKERFAAAIAALRARLDPSQVVAFDNAQSEWQRYCDAWAEFCAGDRATGGTIWPVVYCGAAQATIERRIQEIRSFRQLSDSPVKQPTP